MEDFNGCEFDCNESEALCAFADELFNGGEPVAKFDPPKTPGVKEASEGFQISNAYKLGTKEQFKEACQKYDQAMALSADPKVNHNLRLTLEKLENAPNAPEKDVVDLEQKIRVPIMIRFQYAALLSAYGHENNDRNAIKKSAKVLKDIQRIDNHGYWITPEVQGAAAQLRRGEKIDGETAASEAFVAAAVKSLDFPRILTNPSAVERKHACEFLTEAYRRNESAADDFVEREIKTLLRWDAKYLRNLAEEVRAAVRKSRKDAAEDAIPRGHLH